MKKAKWMFGLTLMLALGLQSADARKDDWTPQRQRDRDAAAQDIRSQVDIRVDQADTVKNRTQFDCREVVGYRINRTSRNRGVQQQPVRECPHVEQMQAGECEMHWLRGMRCKS